MNHFVAFKQTPHVSEFEYCNVGLTKKECDLQSWRRKRRLGEINNFILLFEDGTVYDSFLLESRKMGWRNKFLAQYNGNKEYDIIALNKIFYEKCLRIWEHKNDTNACKKN